MKGVETYLSKLYAVHRTAPEERLAVVRDALSQLGDPQNTIPAVHIAGTSGKGSTAYYVAAMLQSAGYSVGLAVSPHVNTVRERSQVNGAPLPAVEYLAYFNEFVAIVESRGFSFSYIEFLVVFTYWLFAKLELEYMVIEVGLGGRLDPTNTITRPGTVRVITDIGLDHTEILGDTLALIAYEKAGIVHEGDSVVMHRQKGLVVDAIADVARKQAATLQVLDKHTIVGSPLARFQQRNWTLAVAAVQTRLRHDHSPELAEDILVKTADLRIPGRLEELQYEGVTVVLDAAHNVQKIQALAAAIGAKYSGRRAYYVFALGENKASQQKLIIEALARDAAGIYFTRFASSGIKREIAPEVLYSQAEDVIAVERLAATEDPYVAFEGVLRLARLDGGVVVVTGSFYLIDGIRRHLFNGVEEL